MATLHFNDDNFDQEVLHSEQPVLVDFYADWCGPCRVLGPVVEELAAEYGDRAKVGKLNVDDSAKAAQSLQVNSIPTVFVFRNGEVVERLEGVQPKSRYEEALDAAA